MLNAIGETINRAIIAKWIEKGHHLSESFTKALSYEITKGKTIVIDGYGVHYAKYMERGVRAKTVKEKLYDGTKHAETSLYIEALAKYAQRRMNVSKKESLGVAFAIARKHMKFGIRIQDNGMGSKFLSEALKNPDIDRVIDKETDLYLGRKVDGVFNKYFK